MKKKIGSYRRRKQMAAMALAASMGLQMLAGCGQSSGTQAAEPAAAVQADASAGQSASPSGSGSSGDAAQSGASQSAPRIDETAAEPSEMAVEAENSAGIREAYESPAATAGDGLAAKTDMALMPNMTSESYCFEPWPVPWDPAPYSAESYASVDENGFSLVAAQPLSTFAADVDTASYANVRRMIEDGYALSDIYQDAVRAEEFINYFSYDLNLPKLGEKFGVTTQIAPCPWHEGHALMMVGMRTPEIDRREAPDSNLVFLIDVSGSMSSEDKLPLLQKSFRALTETLTKKDRVSIVTYSNRVEVVLDGARGDEKEKICDALDSLYASGGTNGEGGLQEAYALAERSFIKGGNNRILMATDGDLNIGISDPEELKTYIEGKRGDGICLSVLGFGTGNLKDDSLENLADYGDGNYSYIDSFFEAKKVLVEEMGSTLVTVAKDVKLQVEFNPENVSAYRLIGYENRALDAMDFADDTVDGGELGAGHSVIALYEIVPSDSPQAVTLKYGKTTDNDRSEKGEYADEFATVSIRYKEPQGDTSKLVSYAVGTESVAEEPGEDLEFASLVAQFAMILSGSSQKGTASLEGILDGYKAYAKHAKTDEYREEFYHLVRMLAKQQ